MLISVCKENGRLKPWSSIDANMLDQLKPGVEYAVTIKRPRNLKHHRLLWGLIQACYENTNTFSSPEVLLEALKIAVGHFDKRQSLDGKTYFSPRSIGFTAMAQNEFEEFYRKIFLVITERIIPNVNKIEFEQRIWELCGERGPLG